MSVQRRGGVRNLAYELAWVTPLAQAQQERAAPGRLQGARGR